MLNYFQQVRSEMRHVVWPSRNTTIMYTVVVIVISLVVAAYLGVLDYLFSAVLKRLI